MREKIWRRIKALPMRLNSGVHIPENAGTPLPVRTACQFRNFPVPGSDFPSFSYRLLSRLYFKSLKLLAFPCQFHSHPGLRNQLTRLGFEPTSCSSAASQLLALPGHPELPCSSYTSCVMFALVQSEERLPLASLAAIPVPSFSTE